MNRTLASHKTAISACLREEPNWSLSLLLPVALVLLFAVLALLVHPGFVVALVLTIPFGIGPAGFAVLALEGPYKYHWTHAFYGNR